MEPYSQEHVFAIALRAIALAQADFNIEVTLEHVLAALLERPEVEKCLKDLSIDQGALQIELQTLLDALASNALCISPIKTKEFHEVFARTIAVSKFTPRGAPNGLDVLFQFLQMSSLFPTVTLLKQSGLDLKKLRNYIIQGTKQLHRGEEYSGDTEPSDKAEALEYIKKYCIDLNELAKLSKIDPVIGRLSEIDRIVQIIARRTKNNVALVGDPGVGKTALVEGLAYNIVQGTVPTIFKKSTIWSLDVGALVAGTRFRGDFEERMKFLLKSFSLIEEDDPILFIDEIHTIMDAGSGNKGSLDISNLLKPALARGKLRCIGSTTDKDWRQHFEKDRALVRRFKRLFIVEPSIEDAKLILFGLRTSYEIFHHVRYTDEALNTAVDLTVKYVHEGHLPDKAIDVIDEAGARQRISDDGSKETVDVAEIEAEVSRVTKIPLQTIHEAETDRLEHLENDLRAVVFGQDAALRSLVNAVLISRAGLRDLDKAEGSFLFTGPTGVGKTESARQLANTLGLPLVKFDMSEYMEKHSISKFIGSPPGYVGFGDGAAGHGLLINAIDKTPSCVLLLDEIEKAHPDVFNILLQVMEDGILTNSEGRSVSFRNVILIMTSNIGVAKTEQNAIGFVPSEVVSVDEDAVKRTFSPEFRNRLDAIIVFEALDRVNIGKIVGKFINKLQELVQDRGVTIEITDAAKKWLAEKGYDPVYGARPLSRLITDKIKQPLSRLMLFGSLRQGGIARIFVENGVLTVAEKEEGKAA